MHIFLEKFQQEGDTQLIYLSIKYNWEENESLLMKN